MILNYLSLLVLVLNLMVLPAFANAAVEDLNPTAAELQEWRLRAGLMGPDGVRYKTFGDVQPGSPGDWDAILDQAVEAAKNPSNDRYQHYDAYFGLNAPITSALTCEHEGRRDCDVESDVYDREPKPYPSANDQAAISLLQAAFLYQIIGYDGGSIYHDGNEYQGLDFVQAVRNELLHYSENEWLDFGNRIRWSGFSDRSPGYVVTCWLNTLLTAYSWTRDSAVYTTMDLSQIDKWFIDAMETFTLHVLEDMKSVFPLYAEGDFTLAIEGRGEPCWITGSDDSFESFPVNNAYNSRRAAIIRFITRSSVYFSGHSDPLYDSSAEASRTFSERWLKEYIVYGHLSDGSSSELRYGDVDDPQLGLHHWGISLGCALDAVDALARYSAQTGTLNLYDWELEYGTVEYLHFFLPETKSQPWRQYTECSPGEFKSLKNILNTYCKFYRDDFRERRRWGWFSINGRDITEGSSARYIDNDRHVAMAANYYFNNGNVQLGQFILDTYLRNRESDPDLPDYSRGASRHGNYNINQGAVWGAWPGYLFMFGQMQEVVNPYAAIDKHIDTTAWFGGLDFFHHPWVKAGSSSWLYHFDTLEPTISRWFFGSGTFGWMYLDDRYAPWIWSSSFSGWIYTLQDGDARGVWYMEPDAGQWLYTDSL